MTIFYDLKAQARLNLNDNGAISYTTPDMDASFQDAYDDIVCLTQCIIKKVTLSWVANLSYYDFGNLVSDFMAVTAVYNNVNHQWLDDNLSTRDFDNLRIDWEIANGTTRNWAPVNFQYTAMFPRYVTAAGTFDLYYWATAPVIDNGDTPLIASDQQTLLTNYVTADLIEQFEEFKKASFFWKSYLESLEEYKARVQNLVKADLLIRL